MEVFNGLPISLHEQKSISLINQVNRGEIIEVPLPSGIQMSHIVKETQFNESYDPNEVNFLYPVGRESISYKEADNGIGIIDVREGQAAVASLNGTTALVTDTLKSCSGYAMKLDRKTDDTNHYFALAHFTEAADLDALSEYIANIQKEFVIKEVAYSIHAYSPKYQIEQRRAIFAGIPEAHKPDIHEDFGENTGIAVTPEGGVILRAEFAPKPHYKVKSTWKWNK